MLLIESGCQSNGNQSELIGRRIQYTLPEIQDGTQRSTTEKTGDIRDIASCAGNANHGLGTIEWITNGLKRLGITANHQRLPFANHHVNGTIGLGHGGDSNILCQLAELLVTLVQQIVRHSSTGLTRGADNLLVQAGDTGRQ